MALSSGNNKEKNPTFGILFLAIFIDLLGFGIIIPLLPFMVNLFNADDFGGEGIAYAWILAVYSLAQFAVAPFWGRLSDRIGRRPVILIGLLGSSISFGYFAFTETFYSILFSRALAGFFTAASLPAARAYIADITPRKDRAKKFGLLGAAFGLGFTFGPVIGGLLAKISIANLATHAEPGFFAAGMSLVNFMLAYRNLPESLTDEIKLMNQSVKSKSQFHVLREAFSIEGIAVLIIVFAITTFIFSGFEAIFSLFLIFLDSDLDEKDIGLIFGMLGIIV
ncbi:MAG: MFS transporter, partial [Candidatus Heimdallarchaeota archaeon]